MGRRQCAWRNGLSVRLDGLELRSCSILLYTDSGEQGIGLARFREIEQ
jgi:hypothetical protein